MIKKITLGLFTVIALCLSPMNFDSVKMSVAEASINVTNQCWNGDYNYPLVWEAVHSMDFADRSSSCFVNDGSAIIVSRVGISDGEIFRQNVFYFRGGAEDLSYKVDNGSWQKVRRDSEEMNVYRVVRKVLKFN